MFIVRLVSLPLVAVLSFWVLFSSDAIAQVRSSTNYQIESDSINTGGGFTSSESYLQESTVGEIATGESDSETFNLYGGYQQMLEVYLSLSAATDVIMDTALGGVTGGESNGSTSVVAITDGRAGYQLTFEASQSPALATATTSIADYVPAGAAPDAVFTTASTDSHFAYSPFGVDTAARFLISGGICGSGSASSTACWDGASTTAVTIARRTSDNHPAGSTTTVYFKVGIGNQVNQAPGAYVATTTITLLAL